MRPLILGILANLGNGQNSDCQRVTSDYECDFTNHKLKITESCFNSFKSFGGEFHINAESDANPVANPNAGCEVESAGDFVFPLKSCGIEDSGDIYQFKYKFSLVYVPAGDEEQDFKKEFTCIIPKSFVASTGLDGSQSGSQSIPPTQNGVLTAAVDVFITNVTLTREYTVSCHRIL